MKCSVFVNSDVSPRLWSKVYFGSPWAPLEVSDNVSIPYALYLVYRWYRFKSKTDKTIVVEIHKIHKEESFYFLGSNHDWKPVKIVPDPWDETGYIWNVQEKDVD